MERKKNILWGVILIVIGLIIGLNSFGITNIDLFFDGWWTLFIIIPCFIGLINEKEKTGNVIGLCIGLFLLLSAQGIIEFDIIFKLALPLILVIIGLSIMFKNSSKKEKIPDVENDQEYVATFSYQNIDLEKEEFSGSDIDAIFGGVRCDLKNSKLKDKSVINATAIFGGINIIVPKDIRLVVKHTSIFGGVSNKHNNKDDAKKTLYINAICLFGGVEINDKSTKDN